jgi:micrococcal nuclease
MQSRYKYTRFMVTVGVLAVVLFVAYRLFLWPAPHHQIEIQLPIEQNDANAVDQNDLYLVERVIDGDTLVLANGDTVRLIGVDTPETSHPEIPVQRFGKEATDFTRRMVENMKVTLEIGTPEEDAYGRKLAYVFVDNVLLNKEIIRRGYGYAYTRFPHPRLEEFIAAEQEARSKQYGLWNYSLTDGRITNLVNRYEQLSPEAKQKLETFWDSLLQQDANSRKEGEEQ